MKAKSETKHFANTLFSQKKTTTLFRGGRAWSPEAEQHDWILSRCRHTLTTRAVISTGVDACDAVIVAPSQRRMQITWLHWTCLGDNGHPRPSAHPSTRSGPERVGVSSSRLLVQPGPETRVFTPFLPLMQKMVIYENWTYAESRRKWRLQLYSTRTHSNRRLPCMTT